MGIVLMSVVACATCREQALSNSDKYQALGYATRIVVYDLGIDGLLYGAFVWRYHAQCQVLKGEQWLYVCEFGGLCTEPRFRIRRVQYEWTPEAYRKLLRDHGLAY